MAAPQRCAGSQSTARPEAPLEAGTCPTLLRHVQSRGDGRSAAGDGTRPAPRRHPSGGYSTLEAGKWLNGAIFDGSHKITSATLAGSGWRLATNRPSISTSLLS